MMKVLISTLDTQGARPDDYSWVPEGELVARYGPVCDDERPDGSGCGCGRGFGGLVTHRATTMAKVVESDLTEAQWRAQLFATLEATGWADLMDAGEIAAGVDEMVSFDLHQIAVLPVGTVVGRWAFNDLCGITTDRLLLRSICG